MTTGRDTKDPNAHPAPLATSSVAEAAADGPTRGRMDEEARRRIGRDLRLLYASLLDQPLPERLTRLVDELTGTTDDREGS